MPRTSLDTLIDVLIILLKRRTVKVEGVQADWDETILKIAFTDKEKGGGKLETGGIKMEGSVAHIKFRR